MKVVGKRDVEEQNEDGKYFTGMSTEEIVPCKLFQHLYIHRYYMWRGAEGMERESISP